MVLVLYFVGGNDFIITMEIINAVPSLKVILNQCSHSFDTFVLLTYVGGILFVCFYRDLKLIKDLRRNFLIIQFEC